MTKKSIDDLIITNEKKEGSEETVLERIKKLIEEADEVWILMAFITKEGINEIWNELGKKTVKLITSFFGFSNEPKMFEDLNEKQFNISNDKKNKGNFECRIWEDEQFHPKVFIFVKNSVPFKMLIGSSNLTISGLVKNFEINTLVNLNNNELVNKIKNDFLTKWWQNEKAIPLNQEWIDWYYEKNRIDKKTYETYIQINKERNKQVHDFENVLKNIKLSVWKSQNSALHELIKQYKEKKRKKGILALATGLGKTHTAAFFCKLMNFEKILFLAPKEEILIKAREVFLSVFSNKLEWNNNQFINKYGIQNKLTERKRINRNTFQFLFSGQEIDLSKIRCLFATYESWKNKIKEKKLSNIYFDIVIVDEAHHSLAPGLFKILQNCKLGEKFELLGLTATDFRTNFKEMLKLWDFFTPLNFDNHLIHKVTILQGIKNKNLCKFHYHAIKVEGLENKITDEEFDKYLFSLQAKQIEKKLVKEYVKKIDMKLVRQKLKQLNKRKIKALVFCINKDHAKTVHKALNMLDNGIAELVVSEDKSKSKENNRKFYKELRKTIIKEFSSINSKLEFIVSVNIYNEGVDIPLINTVLFLRPTDSPIVFIQQLGRGLRYQDDKELLILDFVRNEKTLINNLQVLSSHYILVNDKKYINEAKEVVKSILEIGCTINSGRINLKRIDIGNKLDYTSFLIKKELFRLPSNRDIEKWYWKTKVSGNKPTLSSFNEWHQYPPLIFKDKKKFNWASLSFKSNNERLKKLWKIIIEKEPFRFYSDIHILKHAIKSNFTKVYVKDLLIGNEIEEEKWKKYLLAFANFIDDEKYCKYNTKNNYLEFFDTRLLLNDKEFINHIREIYNYFESIYKIVYQGNKFNAFVLDQIYKRQDIEFLLTKKRKSTFDQRWLHSLKKGVIDEACRGILYFNLNSKKIKYANKINSMSFIRFPGPDENAWKSKNYIKNSLKDKLKHHFSNLNVFINAELVGLKGYHFYVGNTNSKNIKEISNNLFELKLDRKLSPFLIDLFIKKNVLYTHDWNKYMKSSSSKRITKKLKIKEIKTR